MTRVHLNIGSNLGDPGENIMQAVAQLRQLAALSGGPGTFRQSDIVDSEPWGFESPNRFLNIGVSFETSLSPYGLLDAIQSIERSISEASHRNSDGSYADRMIDIDIIFYGDEVIDTPRLTIPHSRYHLRDFVLKPLRQIDPDFLSKKIAYIRDNH